MNNNIKKLYKKSYKNSIICNSNKHNKKLRNGNKVYVCLKQNKNQYDLICKECFYKLSESILSKIYDKIHKYTIVLKDPYSDYLYLDKEKRIDLGENYY